MRRKILLLALSILLVISFNGSALATNSNDVCVRNVSDLEIQQAVKEVEEFTKEFLEEIYRINNIDLSKENVKRKVLVNKLGDEEFARNSYKEPDIVYHEIIEIRSEQSVQRLDNITWSSGNLAVVLDTVANAQYKPFQRSGVWHNAYKLSSYMANWTTNNPYSSEYGAGVYSVYHFITQQGSDPNDNWYYKKVIDDKFTRDQNPSV